MSQTAFYNNLLTIGLAFDACRERKLIVPALVLLYSAIDIAAWLSCDDPKAKVGTRFRNWVNKYMLPSKPLPCTADDLYGARCGILHTFTAESDSSKKGKARQIGYAWGIGNADHVQQQMNQQLQVMVHIDDLFEAWRLGLLALDDELQRDETKAKAVFARAGTFFQHIRLDKEGKGIQEDA